MTLQQFITALIKRWWLVLICFLAVGIGAYLGTKLLKPIYQSTVIMQVAIGSSNNTTDYSNLLASGQLIQTEATLAMSDPVLREVAKHFPGITIEQLSQEATATARLNTQLFDINVQDQKPARAAAI